MNRLGRRRLVHCCLFALASLQVVGICGAQPSFESPVKVFGLIQRSDPEDSITSEELDALKKFDMLAGLDGHGYNFPGAIDRFRAQGGTTPVLCSANTMDVQADITNDTRFEQINRSEEAFFHSADPASLRVIATTAGVHLWFKPDARHHSLDDHDNAPKVTEYVIEYSAGSDESWKTRSTTPELGRSVYSVADTSDESAGDYRVRTRFTDGTLRDYSWRANALNSNPVLAFSIIGPDGHFLVGCWGGECPQTSDGAVIAADMNNDRSYGGPGEIYLSSSYRVSGAYTVYEGEVDLNQSNDGHMSYRTALSSDLSVLIPANGESYTFWAFNNRVQNLFSSMLVKPGNDDWQAVLVNRLNDCLANGYAGMRLDFAFDDISADWVANSVVAQRERNEASATPDRIVSLYRALKNANKAALLTFNGFFVAQDRSNYVSYLTESDGSDTEFFAFNSWNPNASEPDGSTEDAMLVMIASQRMGKMNVAIVGSSAGNLNARVKSIVLYLLVAGSGSYYAYDAGGTAQRISYFPEWDIPLGQPVREITAGGDISHSSRLLAREFENGWVLCNPGSTALEMEFGRDAFRAVIVGGNHSILGGDGEVLYESVGQSLVVLPGEAVMLVFETPEAP